jgi:GxxExxY protein
MRNENFTAESAEAAETELNALTETIIGAAIEIHKTVGPGLLESVYEECLAFELIEKGLKVARQKEVPIFYKNVKLDCGYRLDLAVNDKVIVEIKCITAIAPIHHAQLISYLKFTWCKVGLIINFHVDVLKNGIRRIVNNL